MSSPFLQLSVPLVLASRSPRRRVMLERLGLRPEILPSHGEENIDHSAPPERVVTDLATMKAQEIAPTRPDALVLGADTIVVLDGDILGKPADPTEATVMLGRLSGRTHSVFTGISLIHDASGRSRARHVETRVTFSALTGPEIERYVAGGSPMDKAGAYGIQDDAGALLVSGIDGDYYNVVGLPLRAMYELLVGEFADLLAP